jgi:hypothetical protein
MFWGLNTKALDVVTATRNDSNHDDISLHAVCASKLDRYLHDVINKGACPMYDADDAFNDPLNLCCKHCSKIPCHSCNFSTIKTILKPFGKILSFRRARLSDDLVGHMMYVKENLVFLHKHYRELRKKETVKELHRLVNLKFNDLIAMNEDNKDIDVGKNDHLLNF